MKYIRTEDGKIIDLISKQVSSYEIVDDKKAVEEYGEDSGFVMVYYYNEDIGDHIEYDGNGGRSMDSWYLKDIIKQADSIAELCDCFVKIKRRGNCKPYILKFDRKDLPTLKEQAIKYKDSPVYGAIHIEDKGLVYVAKMNEEGELELI